MNFCVLPEKVMALKLALPLFQCNILSLLIKIKRLMFLDLFLAKLNLIDNSIILKVFY